MHSVLLAIGLWWFNMKRKVQIAIISGFLAFSLTGAVASTISWFTKVLSIDMNENVTGESNGAYFASGSGEAGDPFIINSPVHLYNLAWLQYLGYFNNNTIGAKSGPTYFAIDPSLNGPIDMTGWILPPIGTTLYPFVGVFNGNGKTIANLTTINSSNVADYPKKPYPVRQANVVNNVNVLGLFGVVGTCGLTGTGVTSVYPAAGYSANAISNFYIDNGHVQNYQSSTLAGIAAGYVNAPLTGVGISTSSSNSPSSLSLSATQNAPTPYSGKTNISEFTSIGYCENAYKDNVSRNYTELYDPTSQQVLSGFVAEESGNDAGWGGSIPMSEMFSSLSTVKTSAIAAGTLRYPTTKTINYDYNGVASNPVYGNYTTSTNMRSVENTSYYSNPVSYDYNYYTYEQKDANNYVTSSYSIVNYSNDNFTCLTGDKTVYIKNAMTTTTNRFETVGDCFYITYTVDGNTHYLSQSNGTLSDQTTTSNATVWALDENNYIYTLVGQTNPQTTYYLRNNNGTLQVSNSTPTQWDTDNSHTYFKNNSYAIQYNTSNSTWYLVEASDATYNIKVNNQNYYVNANGTSGITSGNTATTHWYFESNNGYYILSGGTKYYLGYNNSTEKVGLGTWANVKPGDYAYTYMLSDRTNPTGTGKMSYYGGQNTWYLYRQNNGTMNETKTQNSGTNFQITQYSAAVATNALSCPSTTGFKKYTSSSTTEDSPLELKPTFFPLKQENGVPLETNTGYLVSGGNYTTDQMGDIRFGKFAQSYLPNKLDTIYTIQSNAGTSITIDNSNIVSDVDRKATFDNSKATMQKVLDEDTSGIYGLHFMSATIGSGASVIVPKAVINGSTYYNYEMPTDCIDFNLKTKGYINFFAGSYFYNNTSGKNNSFFTLHEIQRTSNPSDLDNPYPIEKINEIVRIYSDGVESHSYVYEYATADENGYKYSVPFKFNELGQRITLTDGTYTPYSRMNTLYTGYSNTAVFDSSWIGVNTLNMISSGSSSYNGYAYYFDISMNAGEYALGSVPGGAGAYLIYLDIGANATKVFRSTVVELIHAIAEEFTKPLGVAFVVAGATSVNDANSYCVTIKSQYQGVVTVARESAIAATYTESVASELVYLSYAYEELTVNTNEEAVANTKIDQTIKRVTYFDYAASDNSTTKTVISQIITTTTNLGVASNPVTTYGVEQYKHYSSSSSGDKVADNAIKVFNDDGEQITSTQYGSAAFFNSYTSPTSKVYQFATYSAGVGTITMNIVLTTNQQSSESYNLFSARGYAISITLTDNQGNVTDITSQCTIFAKDNNTYVVDQQTGKILLVIHDEFILNDPSSQGD